jgi:hypothetical protein
MTVFVQAIHTIRPIGGAHFDRWVDVYGADVVPALQRNGWDLLGAWKRSSGTLQQDLLLARFESLAAYEQAGAALRKDRAMGERLGAVLADLQLGEEVTLAQSVPYATEQRLERALAAKPEQPRQYLQATLRVQLGGQQVAYDTIGAIADRLEQAEALQLVVAYDAMTGVRGTLNDIWVLPQGMRDLGYRRSGGGFGDLETSLRAVAPEEEITYLNPLPYSPLQ